LQRGGEWTFHGPGQLVIYPLVNLRLLRTSPRCYINYLEQTAIDYCKSIGVKDIGRTSNVGVWVANGQLKIAAIGVHMQQGQYCLHGMSINCNPDLKWFSHIVPCGLSDKGVTSISKEIGRLVRPFEIVDGVREVLMRNLKIADGGMQSIDTELVGAGAAEWAEACAFVSSQNLHSDDS
jgi:lipoyl(octanoyl) transferase 2